VYASRFRELRAVVAPTVAVERDVAAIAEEWDALVDRAAGTPFSRPGWIEAWRGAFSEAPLELYAAREGGRLVALLPLERRGHTLHSPTNEWSFGFELLAEDDPAAQAVAHAVVATPGAERLRIEFLERGTPGYAALRDAAQRAGWSVQEHPHERSPFLSPAGTFDECLERRGGRTLNNYRRRVRILEREGPYAFESHLGDARLEELLTEGYAIEGSGWKTEAGTAIAVNPQARRYFDAAARNMAKRGALRLFFLRAGGKAVAFEFSLEENGVFYYCKGGFDRAYDKAAPGRVMLVELIRRAFDAGLERFEFLGQDEAYKLEWTDSVHERVVLDAFRPSLRGRVRGAAEQHGRPLARKVRSVLRRIRR
jgi:CelD/BcsL family acetyltransferase involved in cellulose biosynthesis